MRKIVINNQKGGSGKTTTAVSLGAALAERGKKVLIVDLDPQASSSIWMGYHKYVADKELFDLKAGPELIFELKQNTKVKNLEIIPFSPIKNKFSNEMKSYPNKPFLLKNKFSKLPKDSFDYILFDCSPGLSLTTINALATCNEIIIPVVAQTLALYGVLSLLETLESVQSKLNPNLKISGILPCRVDTNLKHSLEILDILIEKFGILVYKTFIREDVKMSECASFHQTIFQYDNRTEAALDYKAFTAEVLFQENKFKEE